MIGQTIGHYKIVEKLGEGGMGEVYRAEDTTLKRQVALKVLPAELSGSQERLDRFQREAESLAALNHPNIVMIHTVEEAEGIRFLTMELVEGKQLSALIPKSGMPLERIFEIAVPLADALAAAHERGVIHRDLKPGNIMVTEEGRVKVLDFGLAKLQLAETSADFSELPTEVMTEEGKVLGTYPYMSPEQVEGKAIDHRTDIFSLGIVLHEMTIGERPFKGDSSASLMAAILTATPREVDGLRADLPHHLGRIVAHCLEKNPEDRYQSIKDVRNELKSLKKETESGASAVIQEVAVPPTPTAPWRWLLVVAAAIGVVALVIVLIWGRSKATKEKVSGIQGVTSDAQVDVVAGNARKMIVVLPFENLGSPEDDYFAAGMTEEITSRLAVASGMGVISRTSAMQYKESRPPLKQIGKELGVDYVLEGTVRWAKDGDSSRVRITPQLIQVSDDTHLWADTYDRVIEDVFAIQSEIAESVVTELGVSLLDTERQALAVELTDNPAAYQAYLQGVEIYHRPTTDLFGTVRRSEKMFERAVALDPTFARAWARLARTKAFGLFAGGREPGLMAGAKAALDRATELAPEDPYVRLASGYYHYYGLRDYDRALQEFEAIAEELPNDAAAIEALGMILRRQGRFEESIAVQERALVLDPRNPGRLSNLAITYRHQRRFDEAFRSLDRAIALAPDDATLYERKARYMISEGSLDAAREILNQAPVTDPMHETWFSLEFYDRNFEAALEHAKLMSRAEPWDRLNADWSHGNALLQLGRTEEAREILQEATREAEIVVDSLTIYASEFLGWSYAQLGLKEEAIRAAQRQIELDANDLLEGPLAEQTLAYIYSLVGDPEAAVEIFDRLLATSYSGAITIETLRLDPTLDPIRDDPAFQAMLEKHEKRTD